MERYMYSCEKYGIHNGCGKDCPVYIEGTVDKFGVITKDICDDYGEPISHLVKGRKMFKRQDITLGGY